VIFGNKINPNYYYSDLGRSAGVEPAPVSLISSIFCFVLVLLRMAVTIAYGLQQLIVVSTVTAIIFGLVIGAAYVYHKLSLMRKKTEAEVAS